MVEAHLDDSQRAAVVAMSSIVVGLFVVSPIAYGHYILARLRRRTGAPRLLARTRRGLLHTLFKDSLAASLCVSILLIVATTAVFVAPIFSRGPQPRPGVPAFTEATWGGPSSINFCEEASRAPEMRTRERHGAFGARGPHRMARLRPAAGRRHRSHAQRGTRPREATTRAIFCSLAGLRTQRDHRRAGQRDLLSHRLRTPRPLRPLRPLLRRGTQIAPVRRGVRGSPHDRPRLCRTPLLPPRSRAGSHSSNHNLGEF